jgi:NAD(P)H dehydrogenase (quinone)
MTTTPRILVIIGTPLRDSLNHALAAQYIDAARAGGAHVDVIDLARDSIPAHPTERGHLRTPREGRDDLPLALDVADYIDRVDAADHLVFFFPQWWGTYPAAFKAWIDQVLLSGFAFQYTDGRAWAKLLKGRTARIVMTMDSPTWWNRLLYRDAAVRAVKTATLWYCGVKTVGTTRIPEVRYRSPERLAGAVTSMVRLGTADARRTPSTTVTRARDRVGSAG